MKGLFNAALRRPLNSTVDSAIVAVSGIGSRIPLTLVEGVALYKNGASVTSTTVSDGDTLRLRVTAASTYATPKFGVIQIGNQFVTFAAVTIDDPAVTFDQAADNLLPFDFITNADGTTFKPAFSGNELSLYTATGALAQKIPLNAPTTNANKVSDAVMIADYHRDSIYVFNSALSLIASFSTGVGSKPYGLTTTKTSSTDDKCLTWVTLSGLNKVVAYDVDYTPKFTFNVGTRPLGIVTSPDGNNVYVANYGSSNVTKFSFANDAWTQTTIAVGTNPFELAIDASGNVWVSCTSDDRIYKIAPDNSVTNFATGKLGHRALAFDSTGVLWIAASESDVIVRMNSAGTVLSTIPTGHTPFALSVAEDGNTISVSCFSDSKVSTFDLTGALVRTIDVDKFPYGVTAFSGYTLVANLYSNTPTYYAAKDQAVLEFAIADPLSIKRNVVTKTNVVTVKGLGTNIPVPVSIAANIGATLYKNGVSVGTSSTVVNGDTLYMQFTSPNTYSTDIEIPIVVGNFYESFVSMTEPERTVPDAFSFKAVSNAELAIDYTSNEIKISGLSTGTTVPLTTDAGTIVLNGVPQGASTIQVKNDDLISLTLKSSAVSKAAVYAKVTAGRVGVQDDGTTVQPYQSVWSITAKDIAAGNLWMKPEYKGAAEFASSITGLITDAASKQIARIRNKTLELFNVSDIEVERNAAQPMISSVYDDTIYQFNGALFDAMALPISVADAAPLDIAANRFVLFDNSRILDLETNQLVATSYGLPRKILYCASKDTLYVSISSGNVAVIKKNASNVYAVASYINVGGSPYALTLDSSDGLWVGDLESGKVTYCVANYVVRKLDSGIGVFDMSVSNGALWTVNSYDNSLSKIDIETRVTTTFKLDSSPAQIEIDADGSLWVSMPAKKTVDNIALDGSTIASLPLPTASTFMSSFGGDIYLAALYPNLIEAQEKYSVLTPLALNFGSTTDEARNSHVLSPKIVVAGLIRPTEVFIEPNNNYDLYVNGVKAVTGKAIIANGDIVYLDVLTPNLYYAERVVTLSDSLGTSEFSIRTESSAKPDFMPFLDIYNARPRVVSKTEGIAVSGLIVGQPVLIRTTSQQWKISINGAVGVESAYVKNGDIVQMEGPPNQSYGTERTYQLVASKREYLCGEVTVHTLVLGGALYREHGIPNKAPAPIYEKQEHVDWNSIRVTDAQSIWDRPVEVTRTAEGIMFGRSRSSVHSMHTADRPVFIAREVHTTNTAPLRSFESTARSLPKEFDAPTFQRLDRETQVTIESPKTTKFTAQQRTVSLSKFERNALHTQRTNSRNFVILRKGLPVPVDVQTPFIRNTSHISLKANRVEWVEASRAEQRTFALEPLRNHRVNQILVTFDEPKPFRVPYEVHRLPMREAMMRPRAASIQLEMPVMVRATNRHTVELETVSAFVKAPREFMTVARSQIMRNARPMDRLIDMNYVRQDGVVHDYTLIEPQDERGGYASSEAAIAAGKAAGYPNAYAVRVQTDCFVWATPIETGDFCGVIPPTTKFPIPYRWHMQGG